MPIIEFPNSSISITQGDILSGVTLANTQLTSEGWQTVKLQNKVVIILSRPCVAQNRRSLTVGLVQFKTQSLNPKNLSDAKGMLKAIRDGDGVTSQFYLGQIPGHNGRAYVSFDPLFSIEDKSPHKEELKKLRIARVRKDFMREIHLRIFYAVAHEGFDDDDWYSSDDLQFLVDTAKLEVKQIGLEQEKIESEANTGGQAEKQKDTINRDKRKIELNEKITQMENKLSHRNPPPPKMDTDQVSESSKEYVVAAKSTEA